ncbi:helicase HerA-like domain-containing protein [Allorhizocola rhizosphaerae]|uniref:helicase HerA-like domain-containing protein n=1 Tax=Allorhizocola rhizosphaerae TaxID=1872709 RepID=UPI000E3C141A|nr:helicase HerA-like domain-containing protein [Allorhizocola rhizosphaerae]
MVDVDAIRAGYTFSSPGLELGALVTDGKSDPETPIRIPLSLLNRHGLVAGATGTGKTKTLQVIAEQLADLGVPVFLADIKGDLSGMAAPGEDNAKIRSRMREMGQDWTPRAHQCEFLTLGGKGTGVPVRASITDFGPLLLSKVLDLSEVQASSLNLIFHYADQKGLPMVDLKDLRAVIQFLTSDEGKEELRTIGGLSKQTAGVLLRNLIAFSDAGADAFFGEPEFEIPDLLRSTADGKGIVTLLELPSVVQQPALFSSFLMWMLSELFETLPEVGDPDKPKLVFFFDEAHLLFRDASKPFLQAITQTVRLIRSKGVGVFFVTQTPKDVHPDVLAQLGNRVQHALRAYTPDDAKALKATASTFPKTQYDLDEVLTQLGTGEAVITVLNEKGAPTPVAWTRLRAPQSLMAAVDQTTMSAMAAASSLLPKYSQVVDRESAYEMLAARIAAATAPPSTSPESPAPGPKRSTRRPEREPQPGLAEQILKSRTTKSILTAASTQLIRSLFGTRKH